ncbi:DNA primase [Streptomyces phage Dexers]|uniref:DNA primase n=1 Tax=Streptomyces phage Alsaber TaxID=2053672 RepID=A0A2H4PGJ4_9CAUD|nr:DNA primase [Streptomyces phage Alsaber]ATW61351.1 DNA primase [Streptomyces phage Alsaber]WMI33398.1 DNA primase [Streptomyces phage Provolone]WMI34595.1 DNA primase [Streptomyces phage Dexers]
MAIQWREPSKPKGRSWDNDDDSKPELSAVLDHYEVDFNPERATGMGHCPLHEDNTPSMSYNTDKGLWRCHSCGEGGDSYTMIMLKEGTDFRGARTVATTLGLPEGSSGRSDEQLRGSRYGGSRKVPGRSGAGSNGGGYQPRWRRS